MARIDPLDTLTAEDINRLIEMAWEDRTPFEAIASSFAISEPHLIRLMRRELKPSSFRLWRKRVSGRKTKHRELRDFSLTRDHCPTQYKIGKGR